MPGFGYLLRGHSSPDSPDSPDAEVGIAMGVPDAAAARLLSACDYVYSDGAESAESGAVVVANEASGCWCEGWLGGLPFELEFLWFFLLFLVK